MSAQTNGARMPAPQTHAAPLFTQLAALCWRMTGTEREVLLVSSSSGRWILPKGWPIANKTEAQTALTEAWEEAGVKKGKVTRRPVGSFLTAKRTLAGDDEPCLLRVYAIRVDKTADIYPEREARDRIWVTPEQAASMVDEDGLRDIFAKFAKAS